MNATETSSTQQFLTRGRILQLTREQIVLAIAETDYQIHLQLVSEISAGVGDGIEGYIRAKARRVDVISAGGRYVEPVMGRPRRIQGRIIGGDVQANTIVVDCGIRIICSLMAHQQASTFKTQQMVSFDVEPGASFEQVA